MTVAAGSDRMRAAMLLAFLATAGLAGCSEGQDANAPGSLAEAELAADSLPVEATATTGVIRGIVVDEAIRPLSGVAIRLAGGANTTSNEAGAFGFDGLEAGTYFFTAAHRGYASVQQSVDVEVGIDDPPAVRVLLSALPTQAPFIEAFNTRLFLTTGAWVAGVGGVVVSSLLPIDEGSFAFGLDITPNATVSQAEFVWTATTPLGLSALAAGGTYGEDGAVETDGFPGQSPITARTLATIGNETADTVAFTFWAWPDGDLPAGVHVEQAVDVFVHVFHNLDPAEGWTFVADGAHALPP
jgi:hypothetical protein